MPKDFEMSDAFRRGERVDMVAEPYVRFLKSNYKVIVITVFTLGSLASAYAFLEPPVYETSILLQVQDPTESSSRSSLGDVSSLFAVKPRAATEIEKITSRGILAAAIAPMHLDISLTPRRGILGRVQERFRQAWRRIAGVTVSESPRSSASVAELPGQLRRKQLEVVSEGNGRYRLLVPDSEESFEGTVSTLENFRSRYGTISIKIDSLPGDAGQAFVLRRRSQSAIVDELQNSLNVSERGKESNILSASLEGTDPIFIQKVLRAIGTTYVSSEAARKSRDAQKSIETLSTELPALKAQIEQSEDRYSRFRNETGSLNLGEQGSVVIKQLADVQAKVTDLQMQREELLRRFTSSDSSVLAANRQITTLTARAEQLEKEAKTLPEVEQQALRLSRDITVNNELYAGLLANMQQLRFIKAGRVDEVRLIDDATLPEKPVKPRRWLIVMLGVLSGAFLGTILALVRKLWSGKIDGPDDISRGSGLPVFASGAFSELSSNALFRRSAGTVHNGTATRIAQGNVSSSESLRRFCAAFQYQMHQAGSHIALFSGVNARTGTSLIAEHVAGLLAQGGARVLLVDGDARHGSLSRQRNAGSAPGLSDLISGRSTFEKGVRLGSERGFDFLPHGLQSDGSLGCLSRDALQQSLSSLRDRYEYVILDCAPVLSAAETLVLAHQAGCVFVVAQSNASRLADLEACIEAFESVGVRTTGALLNTVGRKKSRLNPNKLATVPAAGGETPQAAGYTRGSSSAFGSSSLTRQRGSMRDGMTHRPTGLHDA
ncbi:GNVR domain-containing protein [Paraburkholderia sediminicola]|uniref:GNVR domain-containing protein n=1 Tax=Paraburkholderia rhynchosiae TaxID=487049 RepID=A0ACC7N7L4_9BURK